MYTETVTPLNCTASARAIVKQLSCKNWIHLSISAHFYYKSYLQKWRQYVVCRMGLFTDTKLPEKGTIFFQCNVMSTEECKYAFIQDYIRSHTPLAQKLLSIQSALTCKNAR